jgi:Predicted esterase of the alpha-beta hydrolase superfamily
MKVGLLLEGGAMRGLYSAGVLDYFMEKDLKIDGVVGVSAGALFGMNYKSKQIGRVLRYNKKYASNKHYMGVYSWLTSGNIMNEDFCFHKLVHELDPVDFKTYKESDVDFYAVVTNLETGRAEYIQLDDLSDHNQLEYLRASGSMPLVSKIVHVNQQKYLDGGVADSIPIDKILTMGFDKIIVVLTRPIEYRKTKSNQSIFKIFYRKYPQFIQTMNQRYQKYNKDVEKIIELEKQKKIFVIRPSKTIPIKRIEKDTEKIQEMYDLGKNDIESLYQRLIMYLKE